MTLSPSCAAPARPQVNFRQAKEFWAGGDTGSFGVSLMCLCVIPHCHLNRSVTPCLLHRAQSSLSELSPV